MNNDLMFSSANQAWETRWDTFNAIQKQLGRSYNLDPCCTKETAKCKHFITPEQDMFSVEDPRIEVDFGDNVQIFCNPEYGRQQVKFVEHIANWCDLDGVIADVLIPSRSDTKLFHELILKRATSIRFIKGRIIFGEDSYWQWLWEQEYLEVNGKQKKNTLFQKFGRLDAAPFPSMVVSFGEDKEFSYGSLVLPKSKYKGDMK